LDEKKGIHTTGTYVSTLKSLAATQKKESWITIGSATDTHYQTVSLK